MLEKIKEITAESLGADAGTITEETSFKEDLGADSLDLFEMVIVFEGADSDSRRRCKISGSTQIEGRILA